MKTRLLTLLLASLTVFSTLGCSANGGTGKETTPPPKDLLLNSNYVIVTPKDADDTVNYAAKVLRSTMDHKMWMDPDIVTKDPGENAIVISVDDSMSEGQYEFTIKGTSLYITASESHVLLYAVKLLRQTLLDSENPKLVCVSTCKELSGAVDISNLPFTFITQNILFKDIEGGNTVKERAPRFEKLILEYQPDILAIQENSAAWISYYDRYFGKTYFSINQEGNTILFRTDRYDLVESGYFWMSPTPYIKSQFEGDSGPRSCGWALVNDLVTGRTLFVCNGHLDWNNDTSRALQLEVLIEQMSPYFKQYPSLLCGDFNSGLEGPIYARACEILTDARLSAEKNISEVNFTSHSFGEKLSFIDYIFHSPDFRASTYYILSDMYGGYVSDHYGVLTDFSFAQ